MELSRRQAIDKKWQQKWTEDHIFETDLNQSKNKFYFLTMFPYPSGNAHIGHWYNFAVSDITARFERRRDKNVFNPMGFDAFGLPAENAAIKRQLDPAEWTEQNMQTMRAQLDATGVSFDWSKTIATCRPDYYRWTQWMFLFMLKHGLAERREAPVNWCPQDQTILANEQVVGGHCERCGSEVILKTIPQWVFKVTAFADELLNDLDRLDWPDRTKTMQRNWIGRSEGAFVDFPLEDKKKIRVFTTRPDTLFGVTYLVLAPEHPLAHGLTTPEQKQAVSEYLAQASKKSELERTELQKDKTGVFTGSFTKHPLSGEDIPIWIADYVLATVGTGAVMGVPSHDERDFEFANKYDLPIKTVVVPKTGDVDHAQTYSKPGILVDSDEFSGQTSDDAKQTITAALEERGLGEPAVTYRLRDWIVSRQRYWGAPIPIIYCDDCGTVPVPEDQLPVLLPKDVDFKPTGESPLARSAEFVHTTCPNCGKPAKRETDTLDTFVDSSWYFFRYLDPKNDREFTDQKIAKAWLPVDLYVGGAEHTVLHLLYARFFTKALHKHSLSPVTEPFRKLRHQGIILGPDGQKMSKSRGNVIDPDELVRQHGADVVRMYLAFMGPYDQGGPWNPGGIVGIERFLDRVEKLMSVQVSQNSNESLRHQTIKKVTEEIEDMRYNTAIAALMEWLRDLEKSGASQTDSETLLQLLNPFAPHLTEELWQQLGHEPYLTVQPWPAFDEKLAAPQTVTLAVQVNGKLRGTFEMPVGATETEIIAQVKTLPIVQKYLTHEPQKSIVIPDKLVNFVL